MNRNLKSKIQLIAVSVREWAEKNRIGYSPSNLDGMCAIASAELYLRLNQAGVSAVIGVFDSNDGGHCYIIVDKTVVDVTATQFGKGFQPVEIFSSLRKPKKFGILPWWKNPQIFSSLAEFKNFLKEWPEEQQPTVNA